MNNLNTKTANIRIENLAVADLIPSDYQRKTDPTQVSNIVKKFDEAKLGTLTVSQRDGKYYLIDGAHRSKVLRQLGYTHALCVVLTGLTYEQEAEYFRLQNEDKRQLTAFDTFNAGLQAANPLCVRINEIVKTNGFQIGKNNKDFYKLSSIHTLTSIVNNFGYKVLDDTLCLIANTWQGIPRASHSQSLNGVAEFVNRYGMAEFSERMREKFAVVWYDYTEAMRMRGAIGSIVSRKKFCKILVEHYNKGLNSLSKKRLVWEEGK